MGINGLWKALEPLADRRSLVELLTSDALERARNGKTPPVIGIDASPLMFEAQGVVHRARQNGASWARVGNNVAYGCLVKFLEQWARIPVIPLVVFDGNERPKEKRNRQVRQGQGSEHCLARSFRALIEAFGFYSFMAPGEADAELAYLNKAGHVDYVLTSDSDAFVFGAVKIIRCPQLEEDRDVVEVYDTNFLAQHEPGPLSQAGLRFIAVLCGGDYCPEGLRGCGLATAVTLAKKTDLPAMLDAAVGGLGPPLSKWREQLRIELANNPHLRYKRKALASQVPQTFPNLDVVNLYRNPVTSFSRPGQAFPNTDLKYPDSAKLVRLACQLLEWRWVRIFKLLQLSVWPGHCMRQIIEEKKTGHALRDKYCGVEMWISAVQTQALGAYINEMSCDPDPGEATRISAQIWIPASVLRFAHPDAVQLYKDEHPGEFPRKTNPAVQAVQVIDLADGRSPIHYAVTEEPNKPPTIEIFD
ncbi:hypothetical protein EST38_g3352 [Candolleomyces aberdarensis]|uniref:XPG-I domain-containing protein n=1 Tax=Candolleomyces aberdarensis TaxID=2316362 RepID=A0A4Q2DUB3_9AGAR|nr:hypothetical protein EST38_g3352 [Candolleomyces aberdarensis]